MIGIGIGATTGGISGFMSPNDTFQERMVSAGTGALIGGFLGGGIASAANYSPVTKQSFISKGSGSKGMNVKFGRAKPSKGVVPAGKISTVASSVAGITPSFMPSTKNNNPGSSYYKKIDALKAAGNTAGVQKAYVDGVNHARRVGNTGALDRFKNDSFTKGSKLLSGKLKGLWG